MFMRLLRAKFFLMLSFFVMMSGIIFFFMISENTAPLTVAITQIAPHPSLDEIRRGIMDVLKEGGIKESEILFQNAQGSPATALQIAQKFVSLRPKIIIPITTPSAQAVFKVTKDAGIPMIFSAVSDPYAARLMPESNAAAIPQDTIAGVSDLSPMNDQLKMMRTILPNAKIIGVLYNAGEANSTALITLFTKKAQEQGLTVIASTVMGTTNVSTAFTTLLNKVDAVYIPNDNTVISAIESVVILAEKHKMPVFTADPESVQKGALACVAYNQYDIGVTTGKMAIAFLKGEKLSTLGLQTPEKVDVAINTHTAHALGINIPDTVLKKATRIFSHERHHRP